MRLYSSLELLQFLGMTSIVIHHIQAANASYISQAIMHESIDQEPQSWAMLLGGLGLLGAMARRKRK